MKILKAWIQKLSLDQKTPVTKAKVAGLPFPKFHKRPVAMVADCPPMPSSSTALRTMIFTGHLAVRLKTTFPSLHCVWVKPTPRCVVKKKKIKMSKCVFTNQETEA